jgi:hypothetical protein
MSPETFSDLAFAGSSAFFASSLFFSCATTEDAMLNATDKTSALEILAFVLIGLTS